MVSSCKHSTEAQGSIKGGEFLHQLSDYQFLKKSSAPWSMFTDVHTVIYVLI